MLRLPTTSGRVTAVVRACRGVEALVAIPPVTDPSTCRGETEIEIRLVDAACAANGTAKIESPTSETAARRA